jgi:hypothetical protein
MQMPAPAQIVPAAMILSSLALGSCRDGAPAANGNAPQSANVAVSEPATLPVPAPEVRLNREALLMAAIRARSAAAVGTDDTADQGELEGKRFEFRIRLGCSLTSDTPATVSAARYDAQERRIELEAAPDVALDQPIVAAVAGDGVEAVEGFWVPQPWLLAPSCAGADQAQPTVAEPPSVALAQIYTPADPRTERREGRAYQARQSLAEGQAPAAGGWDLVLRGRLRKIAERVIPCRSPFPGAMPVCIISVAFEEVAIERVETGEVLARWGRG